MLTYLLLIMALGLIALLINLVWSTVTLGISPTPSCRPMRVGCARLIDQVLEQQPKNQPLPAIVIAGSGWGGLAFYLKTQYPGPIIAIEAAYMPWLWSRCIAQLYRLLHHQSADITLIKQDMAMMQLPPQSLVVCYLYPKGTQQLYQQLCDAQHQPLGLISIAFAVNHVIAHTTHYATDWMRTPLYWYTMHKA